ncbi:MAG: cell division protein SepF [Bacilli bacterium]
MLNKIKEIFVGDEYKYEEDEIDNEDEIKPIKISKLKTGESEVVITEPLSYSESQSIADYILSNRSIVINLHKVKPEQAKRIIDFISGAVYAIDGTIQKIGEEIFLVAPKAVNVTGNVDDSSSLEID